MHQTFSYILYKEKSGEIDILFTENIYFIKTIHNISTYSSASRLHNNGNGKPTGFYHHIYNNKANIFSL